MLTYTFYDVLFVAAMLILLATAAGTALRLALQDAAQRMRIWWRNR